MVKINLPPEVAAAIVDGHFAPTRVVIDLLRNEFVATVGEGTWRYPEPTVRVNEVLKLSPIDWHNDDLAPARLFYLLNNRTDKEKLGTFTLEKDADVMTFVWPPDEELREVQINGKPFADLTETEVYEIYIGWILALDAQAKTRVADMIEHRFGVSSTDAAEMVYSFASALSITADEVLDLTLAQLLAMVSGSESAAKRFKEKAKRH